MDRSLGARLEKWTTPLRIFAVAFPLRWAFVIYALMSAPQNTALAFGTGIEATNVAVRLVNGEGFASPWSVAGPAMPTAVLPPAYPWLVAAVFSVFGVTSTMSAFVLLTINAVASAAVAPLLLIAGQRLWGTRTGTAAAWLWTLWPPAFILLVKVWPTALSAMLFGLLLVLHATPRIIRRRSVAIGVLWGVAALLHPALLLLLPFALLSNARGTSWRHALVVVAVAVAVTVPWTLRNRAVMGAWIPVRDNFGLELWLRNNPSDAAGIHLHPLLNASERQRFEREGEMAYMETRRREAMEFIRSDFAGFARRCLHRAAQFWLEPSLPLMALFTPLALYGIWRAFTGIGLSAAYPAAALLVFPLTYYITHAGHWYRHPIDPALLLLASFALMGQRGRA